MAKRFLGLLWSAGLVCLAACAGGPPPAERASANRVPELTVRDILAPIDGSTDGDLELARLAERGNAPAVTLRRAYVRLRCGDTDQSLRLLNEVLFGAAAPTTAVESFAYYLRALVWERRGDTVRAAADRKQAAALALDEELAQLARGSAPRPPAGNAVAEKTALRHHPASSWRNRTPDAKNMDPMGTITCLTVHHSAVLAGDDSPSRIAATIRGIQRQHMEENGWADIGYHLLIDRNGEIWEGRERRYQGAHATGANNHGNLGICLLGNFVAGAGGQRPAPQQLAALRQLLRELATRYRIDPDHIYTHRELKVTSCPGEHLQAVMNRLRNEWQQDGRFARAAGEATPGTK